MNKNIKRNIFSSLIFIGVGVLSNIIVRETDISSFSIFEPTNLFTYFGVLIGFALTIYTFGLSMVSDIKSKIDGNDRLKPEKKTKMYNSLVSGFSQIKSDIWLIFYSLIVVILFAIIQDVDNPFGWNIKSWMLPESVNLTLFVTTTVGMWDIMKTLFNLSEINLELNKNNDNTNS